MGKKDKETGGDDNIEQMSERLSLEKEIQVVDVIKLFFG